MLEGVSRYLKYLVQLFTFINADIGIRVVPRRWCLLDPQGGSELHLEKSESAGLGLVD
jgi:hypothetical protein